MFEAKVLSDVSPHVTFDVARNQLARTIDVMLEPPGHQSSLTERNPDRTFLVLVIPELLRANAADNAMSRNRLYGWLMRAYMDPATPCSASTCLTATASNWQKPPPGLDG
jgi:hypothetical protein